MLAAAAPLAWLTIPPLTDVPGHIGRYRVMLDGGAGPLAQWYGFHWRLVGNMGGDLLVAALGPLLGLEPAVKLVAMAVPALTVAGCLSLSRAVHGRVSPFALFALPLAWNQPVHAGFLNYTLAMALALLATSLWLRMAERGRPAALFVAVALAVWVAHALGWAVLCLLVFGTEVARRGGVLRAALACWPLAAPLPLMLAWHAASTGPTADFLDWRQKGLGIAMMLRDRWSVWDVLSVLVVLGVIGVAVASPRVRWARGPTAGALLLAAAFVLLPFWLFGSAFADVRLAPYAAMVALLALVPSPAMTPRAAAGVAVAGLAFLAARTATTTASLAITSARYDRTLAALDAVPVGARIALFASPECVDPWRTARLEHLGGIATARRRAFVNDGWPDIGASLLTIRYPAAGDFVADPSQLLRCDGGATLRGRLAKLPLGAFGYLWLVGVPDPPPMPIAGAVLLRRDGAGALYRIGGARMLTRPR